MGTPFAAPPPVRVTPAPGSRLEQALGMLPAAEAALAEAKQRVDELRSITEQDAAAQAAQLNGGQLPGAITITGAPGVPGLVMRWHGSETTFDKDRFEAAYPGVLAGFRKPKKPYWEMRKDTGRR
jgi:hypothetical protein